VKLKHVVIRYCRPKYLVLTVLLCLSFCIILMYYTKAGQEGIKVYDLTWTDKTSEGPDVSRKWRYFIESKTNLPRKIQKYRKLAPEDDYIMEETLIIGYPSADEIRSVIRDACL